jgi:hypothetical protein
MVDILNWEKKLVNSGGLWRRKGKRSNHLKLPHDEKDSFVARVIFRNTGFGDGSK